MPHTTRGADGDAYKGVRYRHVDTALTVAAERGIDQVVLLAAVLDSRAFRLSCAAGTSGDEVDQPPVLAFRDGVLAEHGAAPTCDQRDDGVSGCGRPGPIPRRGLGAVRGRSVRRDGRRVALGSAPCTARATDGPVMIALGAPFGTDLRRHAGRVARGGQLRRRERQPLALAIWMDSELITVVTGEIRSAAEVTGRESASIVRGRPRWTCRPPIGAHGQRRNARYCRCSSVHFRTCERHRDEQVKWSTTAPPRCSPRSPH
mgnify:CR=1 FL=1